MNNARSLFTLITAATAVASLAAGMLLALSAPAPTPAEFAPSAVALLTAADED